MTLRLPRSIVEDPRTRRVLRAFRNDGYQALLVGGTVRNALLGVPVTDIDIATNAVPDEILSVAEGAGIRAVPTGISHGTVTLVIDSHPFEVTTFRKDIDTDGRRATVSFSTNVADDAARRDFTMNALYATGEGAVVDPLNGLPDLKARRVRFVGTPAHRIQEDYLRILRFFRFTAWYADPSEGIEPEGLSACAELADGLSRLSVERVWDELRKLLSAPDPSWVLAAMDKSGVLVRCLPGTQTDAIAMLLHAEAELGLDPDPMRRLVALGGTAPEAGMRLSRADTRHLARLRSHVESGDAPLALGHLLGVAGARDVIALRFALIQSLFSEQTLEEIARGANTVFPVRAADLPANLQGPEIGQALERLKSAWLSEGCVPDKAELLGRL
ncbi:MAG: CCA tRNA nucleotidyltransferase [Dinoroseobacter sp.]|nr:CCA tRNA nucleotidyltransferase [Dinoroseobacter sp.]